MIQRRSFMAGILTAGMAPAIGHAGILMPVRKIITDAFPRYEPFPWETWQRADASAYRIGPTPPEPLWETPDGSRITSLEMFGEICVVGSATGRWAFDVSSVLKERL